LDVMGAGTRALVRVVGAAAVAFCAARAPADVSVAKPTDPPNADADGFQLPEWAVYVVDDSPTETLFVLYADGRLIYAKGHPEKYFIVQLSDAERRRLRSGLPVEVFEQLPHFINADRNTEDGASFAISHWNKGKPYEVAVSGELTDRDHPEWGRKLTPRAFLAILDRFLAFKSSRAVPWGPSRVQVRYGFKYERDRTQSAPGWPSYLPNPVGFKGRMFLEAARIGEFQRYLQTLEKDRYPIELEPYIPYDEIWKSW
jgi:hypothetical protein